MTKKNATTEMRRCIGSKTFGIEPHEAPVEDFPKQPSQRDGLGRMCRPHWNQYTTALRKAALERKEAEEPPAEAAADPDAAQPAAEEAPGDAKTPKAKRGRRRAEPSGEVAHQPAAG